MRATRQIATRDRIETHPIPRAPMRSPADPEESARRVGSPHAVRRDGSPIRWIWALIGKLARSLLRLLAAVDRCRSVADRSRLGRRSVIALRFLSSPERRSRRPYCFRLLLIS
jgi:hypothetical protein